MSAVNWDEWVPDDEEPHCEDPDFIVNMLIVTVVYFFFIPSPDGC